MVCVLINHHSALSRVHSVIRAMHNECVQVASANTKLPVVFLPSFLSHCLGMIAVSKPEKLAKNCILQLLLARQNVGVYVPSMTKLHCTYLHFDKLTRSLNIWQSTILRKKQFELCCKSTFESLPREHLELPKSDPGQDYTALPRQLLTNQKFKVFFPIINASRSTFQSFIPSKPFCIRLRTRNHPS